jgi:xylulokinase
VREAVLGVDVGTGSLKAGLFALSGEVIAFEQVAYGLSSRSPGAMEQDPDDWWTALGNATRRLLTPDVHVAAACIGGQSPTLCAVDADLRPTHPAITWLDQRSAAEAERLYASLRQPVPIWGSWPGQAAWLKRNRADAWRRTRWLLGCPDYLVSRLTREPAAFLSVPLDEVEAAEVDAGLLPPRYLPGCAVGTVTDDSAGLPAGTRVVAGFVDGIMGVLGSGVSRPGEACLNAGTSGTFSVVCQAAHGYPVLDMSVVGAPTNTSGKALDWFVQQIACSSDGSYSALLAGAAEVSPGSDGLLFLPHLAGERAPVRDVHSRGAWVGLSLAHDRRHLLRSLLEGVAFGFRAVAESLGVRAVDVRIVGGQARAEVWNQIKADVLGLPVLVPEVLDAAVCGGAIVAAVGIGAYPDRGSATAAMVRIARRFEPDPATVATYDALHGVWSRLYPELREINWQLARGMSS